MSSILTEYNDVTIILSMPVQSIVILSYRIEYNILVKYKKQILHQTNVCYAFKSI